MVVFSPTSRAEKAIDMPFSKGCNHAMLYNIFDWCGCHGSATLGLHAMHDVDVLNDVVSDENRLKLETVRCGCVISPQVVKTRQLSGVNFKTRQLSGLKPLLIIRH